MSSKLKLSILTVAISGLLHTLSLAQTCVEPTASQFRTVTLVAPGTTGTLYESGNYGCVGMSITPDGKVFIAKMKSGEIRVYDPANANTTTLAGTIPTFASTEDGLLGVVVDPNYATNKWVYAFYSDPCGLNCTNRAMELARFTYVSTNAANAQLTNKKIILRFPREKNDDHHAAGNMSFDKNGVLVIGVGDNRDPHNSNNNGYGPIYYPTTNADAQGTSANTNDLRGKVLRIKPLAFADNTTPTPGIDSTYSIPSGNLWEKINNTTYNPGWRNDSDDISKVRKEIYVMGNRNPFHPRVDTRSGWIFWGEIGPDANSDALTTRGPSGHDEWNFAATAGFYGHPYCNGYNVPYGSLTSPSTTYGSLYDCKATGNASLTPLINKSPNNTGIKHLPPPVPAVAAYTSGNSTDDDPRFNATYSLTTIAHASESSIGGPMYRYDSALASTIKFPPYYEGKIFFFDWARRSFRILKMRPDGTLPKGDTGVVNFAPNGFTTNSYLDMQFGPDGALYMLRNTSNGYSGGDGALYRVEYTGTYDNTCYRPFDVTVLGPGATQGTTAIAYHQPIQKSISPVMANGMLMLPEGYKGVELFDMSGRQIWNFSRDNSVGSYNVRLPANLGNGIWQAKLVP
ncbi:MAG TPA: hypothetical protein DCQ83_00255 [Fibrobacteres bacterium]|jgi:cytochrome c|nr:hypothetical protein [Fibrobacterota bacterium]